MTIRDYKREKFLSENISWFRRSTIERIKRHPHRIIDRCNDLLRNGPTDPNLRNSYQYIIYLSQNIDKWEVNEKDSPL